MKIHITNGFFHHMNKISMDYIIKHLNITVVNNIDEADVVYSPSVYVNTELYPNKTFIFGPHFSVFPNNEARSISNKNNNAIYIQPSEPSVNTWVNEFNFNNIPVRSFPFPLKVEDYPIKNSSGDRVLIYYKERDPSELQFLKTFLDEKNVSYDIIRYGSYREEYYQNKLNNCKYVIWLGRHESQGFALQSVMCKNIPLLVWGVKQRSQQHNCLPEFYDVKSEVSTVPYWSDKCGELFYNREELSNSYDNMVRNLETYQPRKFIEENLSVGRCSMRLLEIIEKMK